MEELEIRKHSFEVAKSKIQKYADSSPQGVTLPRVKTDGGLFGWGDHKVTGDELNSCMGEVQTSLISLNNASKAIISEFKEVYNAFEALDKDYISGIILSVNAAKKASDDAKKASDDIAKTIGALKITVGKLSDFQKEVRSDISALKAKSGIEEKKTNRHIDDVDSIWEDVQNHQQLLSGLEGQLQGLEQALSILNQFKNELDGLNHLADVDSLWSDLQKHYESYKGFYDSCVNYKSQTGSTLETFGNQIKDLTTYRNTLEQLSHLQEVDAMWNSIREHCKRLDEHHNSLSGLTERIDASISQLNSEISVLQVFKEKVEQYRHLSDIDIIWDEYQNSKTDISNISDSLNNFKQQADASFEGLRLNISELKNYSDKLKAFSHLNEVDSIWDDTQELKKNIDLFQHQYNDYVASMSSSFSALSQNVEMLSSVVEKHTESINHIEYKIESLVQKIESENKSMSHRVRVNHIIATSSILMFLVLLALNVLKVL